MAAKQVWVITLQMRSGFQLRRQLLQGLDRLKHLLGYIGHKGIPGPNEPDRIAHIIDKHHHQGLVDATQGDLEPVPSGHRLGLNTGRIPRILGLVNLPIIGFRALSCSIQSEFSGRSRNQIKAASATRKPYLRNGFDDLRIGDLVIADDSQPVGIRAGANDFVIAINHNRGGGDKRQQGLGRALQSLAIGLFTILAPVAYKAA